MGFQEPACTRTHSLNLLHDQLSTGADQVWPPLLSRRNKFWRQVFWQILPAGKGAGVSWAIAKHIHDYKHALSYVSDVQCGPLPLIRVVQNSRAQHHCSVTTRETSMSGYTTSSSHNAHIPALINAWISKVSSKFSPPSFLQNSNPMNHTSADSELSKHSDKLDPKTLIQRQYSPARDGMRVGGWYDMGQLDSLVLLKLADENTNFGLHQSRPAHHRQLVETVAFLETH